MNENELNSMTVGDLVTLQRGNTYKSALLDQPGPVLLGLASIQKNGGFRSDKLRTYGGDSPEKLILKAGDIYVALKDVTQSGDLLGAVSRVPKSIRIGRLTQDTVKLVFKKNNPPVKYIYWLLRTPQYREYCRARATGTTNLSLSREDFLAFPVPAKTLERNLLVKILETLDDKIELNQKMNQTLEAMARAIFKSWFVDFDPVKAKMAGRQPAGMDAATAALFPDSFQDSPLGLIPKGWEVASLGDVVDIKHGYAFKSEFFSKPAPGVPIVVNIGNFKYTGGFRFESTTLKGYMGEFPEEFILCPGDILLVMTCQTAGGEILGIPGRIPNDGRTYLHNQRMGKVVVTNSDRVNRHFLYQLFLLPEFNRELFSTASGTKILHTSPSRIEAFQFCLPPIQIQLLIGKLLESCQNKISFNEAESKMLANIRDTLLPKLLSGKIKIKEVKKLMEAVA